MILVTMGTQPLQCERIIDAVLNAGIKEKLVIQAYNASNRAIKNKNVEFLEYVPYDKMEQYIEKADIIVVSGTGGILRALLKEKKVIIFPRLAKYGEAIDDHGLDMKVLADKGYAEFVSEADEFKAAYKTCKNKKYKKFISNNDMFVTKLMLDIKELG